MTELSKETVERIYEAIEVAKSSGGKIRKGSNEVTKSLEKGDAKLVIVAKDVQPAEIVMHLSLLAQEKKVPFAYVPSKTELGAAAGMSIGTAAVAIVEEGEAKKIIQELAGDLSK